MKKEMQRGFALIVVLGILAVAALIIGTIIARQETDATWTPVTDTKEQLDDVHRALAAYERTEHRLPMPAPRTGDGGLKLHAEALALLQGSEDAASGYILPDIARNQLMAGNRQVMLTGGVIVASSDPQNLREIMVIGAVPTETLGLPREAAEDTNGHLLTYAVTFEMINRFKYKAAEGVIALKDEHGQPVANKLAYVVLSHGKDAKGAWSAKSRTQGRDCSGNMNNGSASLVASPENNDYGNCSYDGAVFVVKDLTLIRGEGYFDDQLLHGKKDQVGVSQNQSCLGPVEVSWGDPLCPACSCSGTIAAPGLVSVGTHGEPKTVELNDTTPSDVGKATFECNDGATSLVAGSNSCTRPCVLPWNPSISIDHGDSVQAYSAGSVGCAQSCPPPVTRVCMNGTLSDSGDHPSCHVDACSPPHHPNCPPPSPPYWDPGNNRCTDCAGQGNVTQANMTCTCPDGGPLSSEGDCDLTDNRCSLPWGGSIAEGESVEAFQVEEVPCGETCADSTTRTCSNGQLSGSGDFGQCTPAACAGDCDLPWGGTIADGASVQAFASSEVECGETCPASTPRTCSNGMLSGSGDHAACTVRECGSCELPWGGTLANGQSVAVYSSANVACGETCPAPTPRTCNNGVLSGSGVHPSCSPAACASCTLPWGGAIAHGQEVTAYAAPVYEGCDCYGEQRRCNNGNLSGSHTFQSCRHLGCRADCNAGGGMCVDNGTFWTTKCERGWKLHFRCVNGMNESRGGNSCTGDEMCH